MKGTTPEEIYRRNHKIHTSVIIYQLKTIEIAFQKNVEHQKHTLPAEPSGLKSYKEVQKSYQYNTNKSQSHSESHSIFCRS